MKIAVCAPLGALLACAASPALADHMGPSGFGSGGGMSVFSPDTLDGGHWAAGFRLSYTRPEQRPDAELEARADSGIDAHNTDYNLNASLGIAYGVSHHLTISAEVPYIRRARLREGVAGDGVERIGSVAGIGDMNLLVKYRLTEGAEAGFALIGGIKLPTGSTGRRAPDGERLETEHQPGSGSWDPIVGASASSRLGAVQVTASALYQFATSGAQHTRLGNRLQGGIALSHRLSGAEPEAEHEHEHDVGEEYHHHGHGEVRHGSWDGFVELAGEWEGRQKIGGHVEEASGGKWAWVAPGVRFNSASGWSAAAALAVPVWQDIRVSHPDNRYRLTLSLARAF
ncbi:MAG: hypothetical protein ACM3ZV_04865 [Bacillota bacterium]